MKHTITANRLKEALIMNNMRAQDLANKSGVGKASISQYINGTHKPSNITATKLAMVLHVSPLWLMGFDVEMSAIPEQVLDHMHKSVDDLAEQLSITDDLQRVLNKDPALTSYEFTEDQLLDILRYARFIAKED